MPVTGIKALKSPSLGDALDDLVDRIGCKDRGHADHNTDRVMFMHNRVDCDACRLLQRVGFAEAMELLHVVISGEDLVVTAVDNLHAPGTSISARKILDFPDAMVFRLLREPVLHVEDAQHRPATGIAVLSWCRHKRRLMMTGVVEGMSCEHDRIVNATEA